MSRMDLPAFESLRGEFAISTNRDALDLDVIHNFLADSDWAAGIPRDVVARSIQNSLCFDIYQQQQQVGFARVISDFATYAYIADVFVVDGFRGRGLGKWLMECIMAYPQLQHLRRWGLATRDALVCTSNSGSPLWLRPDATWSDTIRMFTVACRLNNNL